MFAIIQSGGRQVRVEEGTVVPVDHIDTPVGNTLTFAWSAPSGIVLSDSTAKSPTFTAPAVTEVKDYVIGLVVNDGTIN